MESLATAQTTSYGAATAPLPAAASLLRTMGANMGIHCKPASSTALAAAVIAADLWVRVHHTTTLSTPLRHGHAAVEALSAILLRACGQQPHTPTPRLPNGSVTSGLPDAELAMLTDGAGDWAYRLLGSVPAAQKALGYAAHDLATSGAPSLQHAADALEATADYLEAVGTRRSLRGTLLL